MGSRLEWIPSSMRLVGRWSLLALFLLSACGHRTNATPPARSSSGDPRVESRTATGPAAPVAEERRPTVEPPRESRPTPASASSIVVAPAVQTNAPPALVAFLRELAGAYIRGDREGTLTRMHPEHYAGQQRIGQLSLDRYLYECLAIYEAVEINPPAHHPPIPGASKVLDSIAEFHFTGVEEVDGKQDTFRVQGTVGLQGGRRFHLDLFVVTFKGELVLYPPVG